MKKAVENYIILHFKTGQKNLLSTPCGSPCYASPEMVAGKKYDGFKIDVWSIGAITYFMCTSKLPFDYVTKGLKDVIHDDRYIIKHVYSV